MCHGREESGPEARVAHVLWRDFPDILLGYVKAHQTGRGSDRGKRPAPARDLGDYVFADSPGGVAPYPLDVQPVCPPLAHLFAGSIGVHSNVALRGVPYVLHNDPAFSEIHHAGCP